MASLDQKKCESPNCDKPYSYQWSSSQFLDEPSAIKRLEICLCKICQSKFSTKIPDYWANLIVQVDARIRGNI